MLLIDIEKKVFNPEEIGRGTLIWAKHKTWQEGQSGLVTEVSEEFLRIQYLPSIQNVLNHYFVSSKDVQAGEWEIRYSSDGLMSVKEYPVSIDDDTGKEEA